MPRVRIAALVLVFSLFSVPAQADPPHFLQRLGHAVRAHKLLLAEASAMEVSAQFDIHSTESALRRCPTCEEGNPLLGSHPSPARLQVYEGGLNILMSTLNGYELRNPGCGPGDHSASCKKGFWRSMSLVVTGEAVGLHAYATHHNNEQH
jgi:hypothetical protein